MVSFAVADGLQASLPGRSARGESSETLYSQQMRLEQSLFFDEKTRQEQESHDDETPKEARLLVEIYYRRSASASSRAFSWRSLSASSSAMKSSTRSNAYLPFAAAPPRFTRRSSSSRSFIPCR